MPIPSSLRKLLAKLGGPPADGRNDAHPIHERTIETNYPVPTDLSRVGQWPASSKSGGGYFYDEVLEYRVWVHPERGGEDLYGGEDYFHAFAVYEHALEFSRSTEGAEEPLALVRQVEWVDEPEPGVLLLKSGERVTEWRVDWLSGSHRTTEKIRAFLARNAPLDPDPSGRPQSDA